MEGWLLGKPDLVLTAEEDFVVGPGGRDVFRCFVLPTNLTEDKYVVAFEVKPSNPRIVHHTLNFIDSSGRGRKLEEQGQAKEKDKKPDEYDRGPGYSMAMGVGFQPNGGLGGLGPGPAAQQAAGRLRLAFAQGIGRRHAGPLSSQRPRREGPHADRPVLRQEDGRASSRSRRASSPVSSRASACSSAFPPMRRTTRSRAASPCDEDCTLYSIMPHMHLLGKEIKVTMSRPDGDAKTLLAIKDWDYNWQETYFLKEPMKLKAGDVLEVEAVYDNSAQEPEQSERSAARRCSSANRRPTRCASCSWVPRRTAASKSRSCPRVWGAVASVWIGDTTFV